MHRKSTLRTVCLGTFATGPVCSRLSVVYVSVSLDSNLNVQAQFYSLLFSNERMLLPALLTTMYRSGKLAAFLVPRLYFKAFSSVSYLSHY